ncbi:MAG: NAD(P)H-hydrate dehydratase [Bacteroidales bacterium]|nr:NAD(P)H-hydrate dehydratase [Bacteroidales bacterium]
MYILKKEQLKQLDTLYVAKNSLSSYELMEKVSEAIFERLRLQIDFNRRFIIIAGTGNNGGDALAIARMFLVLGMPIEVYIFDTNGKKSIDFNANLEKIVKLISNTTNSKCVSISQDDFDLEIVADDQIIDGLFGFGLNRELDSTIGNLINQINKSKFIYSIDLPSGLFCESNLENSLSVVVSARRTYTIQTPKLPFFFNDTACFAGDVEIIDVGMNPIDYLRDTLPYRTIEKHDIKLPKRNKFSHKGHFGHGLLIAGSKGMAGAAILAAKASLKSGIGLLTCHIPALNVLPLQISLPEAICVADSNMDFVSNITLASHYTAIAIGPGLSVNDTTCSAFEQVLKNIKIPMVIDADGLNIISKLPHLLQCLPANTILTPHPKEFDRLFGNSKNSEDRFNKQVLASKKYGIIIVLKGHNSSISLPTGEVWFNTTGNAGMATAGSGDLLTGMILSFLAQGFSASVAARYAVYLHGLAGDIAAKNVGEYSLIASDIIDSIFKAIIECSE